jgi:hypothetical protein
MFKKREWERILFGVLSFDGHHPHWSLCGAVFNSRKR